MAYRDYVHCRDCDCKLIYDGHDDIRESLEKRWGDPNAPTWTVDIVCPECLAKLRAELAAAQKDATLFLWLADAEPFSARWQIVRLEWWRGREGWSDVRGEALRLAIGAAMAQEKRDDRQRGV